MYKVGLLIQYMNSNISYWIFSKSIGTAVYLRLGSNQSIRQKPDCLVLYLMAFLKLMNRHIFLCIFSSGKIRTSEGP